MTPQDTSHVAPALPYPSLNPEFLPSLFIGLGFLEPHCFLMNFLWAGFRQGEVKSLKFQTFYLYIEKLFFAREKFPFFFFFPSH